MRTYSRHVARSIDSPFASNEQVRRKMQTQPRSATVPELALRRALHRLGYRYRVDVRPVPTLNRRADLVFTRAKVAVFVDGCFWHGCPQHGKTPSANSWYWPGKISSNVARDRDTDERLRAAGWTVLRIWEHVLVDTAAQEVAAAVSCRPLPDMAAGMTLGRHAPKA